MSSRNGRHCRTATRRDIEPPIRNIHFGAESHAARMQPRRVSIIETRDALDSALGDFLRPSELPQRLAPHVALLLDYDGTLAPVTEHPHLTFMLPRTQAVLERLAAHPRVRVAVISGRGRTDVQRRVGIAGCTYSGNHGLEIFTPPDDEWQYSMPAAVCANFGAMVERLERRARLDGAWVENKCVSLTVHYRDASPDRQRVLHADAEAIIAEAGFVACRAHGAIEARPPVRWTKGDAALRILDGWYGPGWRDRRDVQVVGREVRVIFAGDDRSDEDAMRALQGLAVARTFRVAEADREVHTEADWRLAGQSMVTELLEWIEAEL